MIEKESRINGKRFDALEERFDRLEGRFGTLEGRVGSLEGGLASVKESMLTKHDLRQFEVRILAAIGDITIKDKDRDKRILVLEKIVKP